MAMKIGLTEARIQVRKEKTIYIVLKVYRCSSNLIPNTINPRSHNTNLRNFKLISQSFWFLSDIANAECNILY